MRHSSHPLPSHGGVASHGTRVTFHSSRLCPHARTSPCCVVFVCRARFPEPVVVETRTRTVAPSRSTGALAPRERLHRRGGARMRACASASPRQGRPQGSAPARRASRWHVGLGGRLCARKAGRQRRARGTKQASPSGSRSHACREPKFTQLEDPRTTRTNAVSRRNSATRRHRGESTDLGARPGSAGHGAAGATGPRPGAAGV